MKKFNSLTLEERIQGDELLNAKDTLSEIANAGGEVDMYGNVTVYHRTDPKMKDRIEKTGIMISKEDGLFFSTKENGQNEGYGEAVVKLSIPVEKLVIDDFFGDEIHFRCPLENTRRLNVSDYLLMAADVKNSCDELEDMERKVLPTFNSQEEEEYQNFKDMQNDDERGPQQCIDYLQDSLNDILFFYEKQDGTWGDTADTYYYYHNYDDQDKEHSAVLKKNRFIDDCMTKWQQLSEFDQTHTVRAVVAIARGHYISGDFEDSRVGRLSDTPKRNETENDFEFCSESGYVKIDKLTVGDFAADLKKVNKSMPDITAKGMRYIENELRYYYDNLKVLNL